MSSQRAHAQFKKIKNDHVHAHQTITIVSVRKENKVVECLNVCQQGTRKNNRTSLSRAIKTCHAAFCFSFFFLIPFTISFPPLLFLLLILISTMESLKSIGTQLFNLDFNNDRRIFRNTDHWALAPQPKDILYPEYFDLLVNWRTPIVVAALYVLMVVLLNPKQGKVSRVVAADTASKGGKGAVKKQELSESTPFMTTLVFVHNAILCVYSAWTFYGMFLAWKDCFATHSFMEAVRNFLYC